MTTQTPDSNDERDHAALRRMLDHAPDHAARPDTRLRAAILARARESLRQPPQPVTEVPWKRRLKAWLGLEGRPPSRGPWQAAFATVALAVLVTLMWQHEPVPGPRLDGAPEAPTPAPSAALPAPAAVQQAAPAPQQPEPKPAAAAGAPPTSPPKAADAAPAPSSEKSRVARPRPEAPAAAKAAAPVAAEMAQPAAPVAPAPPAAPSGPMSLSIPGPAGPSIAAAPIAPSARAAAPAARARIAADASFAALGAWTRLTFAQPDGRTRSLSREEAGALAALVDSAARSGTSTDSAESRIDWRITFERDGEAIATLELAGDAVRWREGSMPARTGRPPPQLLEALRGALGQRLTGG